MYILGMLLLFLILIIIRSNYEMKTLEISQYTIHHKKITSKLDGLRICFITDMHNHQFGNDNEQLIKAIEKENPDLVLIGGDLLVGKPGAPYDKALQLLEQLVKRYKVYYSNGNHESRMKYDPELYGDIYKIYAGKVEDLGVTFLNNDTLVLEDLGISIKGLEIPMNYYKKGSKKELPRQLLVDCLGKSHKEYFQLLLAHNPIYFEEYCDWGADLVLSGHVHGGIVQLPYLGGVISTQFILFPKYDSGKFAHGRSRMILSRGLGTHTIRFRLFNYPELCIITLKEKE